MKRKSLTIIGLTFLVILALLTRSTSPNFPNVTISVERPSLHTEEISSEITENLEKYFTVKESNITINFPNAQPVLSLLANKTEVYVFLYPNATSALNAERKIKESLKLRNIGGFLYRGARNETFLLFYQYINYNYVLILAKGPRNELKAVENCIVIFGPSPEKILYLFTPLGRKFSDIFNPESGGKRTEEWLEAGGIKLSGYLDKLEGNYKGCKFAIFVYRPKDASKVYEELRKAFKNSGWKENSAFALPSDITQNPFGRMIGASLLVGDDKAVYLELAHFPGGHRISILYCNNTEIREVIKELW
ncbi:hypothetical protein PNA2_1498 [Pyrococcus sp. NA2]|uniref:hypothetical protein n=1 Tax=Pyrococcus sp. (strain NA2) TaxID=342949 RepID=UPI000209B00C|nr:hypothetical protein [Pyrococcus sp. NA2]AEC52413.1 hypothetical protein PNA2_1498 [Pyrococcus sp. NA2]